MKIETPSISYQYNKAGEWNGTGDSVDVTPTAQTDFKAAFYTRWENSERNIDDVWARLQAILAEMVADEVEGTFGFEYYTGMQWLMGAAEPTAKISEALSAEPIKKATTYDCSGDWYSKRNGPGSNEIDNQ